MEGLTLSRRHGLSLRAVGAWMFVWTCLATAAACGREAPMGLGAGDAGVDGSVPSVSLLPVDRARFVIVRDCRLSIDHDLNYITIKTAPVVAPLYLDGPFPLPIGTVVLKEQFLDPGCSMPAGFTLMKKEAPGYDGRYGDWHWQRLNAAGRVLADGAGSAGGAPVRCASCHAAAACRARDFTCAEP